MPDMVGNREPHARLAIRSVMTVCRGCVGTSIGAIQHAATAYLKAQVALPLKRVRDVRRSGIHQDPLSRAGFSIEACDSRAAFIVLSSSPPRPSRSISSRLRVATR